MFINLHNSLFSVDDEDLVSSSMGLANAEDLPRGIAEGLIFGSRGRTSTVVPSVVVGRTRPCSVGLCDLDESLVVFLTQLQLV